MADTPIYRAELNYQNKITADEITVIFNGTTYTVPKYSDGLYGSEALTISGTAISAYPFCIARVVDANYVYVNADVYNNHNPFTIKIIENLVTTTECFEKAVQSVASPLVVQASREPSEGTSNAPSVLYASASEICDAMKTRGVVVEDPYGNLYSVLYATDRAVTIISSEYNSTATPPTVLQPYMYTSENNVLRYPKSGLA